MTATTVGDGRPRSRWTFDPTMDATAAQGGPAGPEAAPAPGAAVRTQSSPRRVDRPAPVPAPAVATVARGPHVSRRPHAHGHGSSRPRVRVRQPRLRQAGPGGRPRRAPTGSPPPEVVPGRAPTRPPLARAVPRGPGALRRAAPRPAHPPPRRPVPAHRSAANGRGVVAPGPVADGPELAPRGRICRNPQFALARGRRHSFLYHHAGTVRWPGRSASRSNRGDRLWVPFSGGVAGWRLAWR